MEPLVLFPDKRRLGIAAALGALIFCLGLPYLLRAIVAPSDDLSMLYAGGVFAILGLGLIVRVAFAYFGHTPSFVADAVGFSVRGRTKRPWSDFHGTRVRTTRVGIIPVSRDLQIKLGKGLLAGSEDIQAMFLPGPASKMARKIDAYAELVANVTKIHADLGPLQHTRGHVTMPPAYMRPKMQVATPSMVKTRPPAPLPPMPDQSGPAIAKPPLQRADNGPVTHVPRLSERIFGTRSEVL